MKISNEKIQLLIRVGLAFVFLYAGIAALVTPLAWVGFFPNWLRGIVSGNLLIILFSVYQIILAVWLISGKKTFYAALASAVTLLAIIISNVQFFDIVFRDIYILFSALTLTALTMEESIK